MSRVRLRRYFRHGLLPQLIVFEAVARLGGVTRAAGELHLAQPTVSLQIKKLSGALQVVLFERRGRRLHLTAAGHALRETCEELMELLLRAEERLAAWRTPGTESLRLAGEPEARELAARLIAALRDGLLDVPERAANNSAGPAAIGDETEEESRQWKSRATTTRRRT